MEFRVTTAISGEDCRKLNPTFDHIIRSWLICTVNSIEQNECFDGLGSPLVSENDNILYGILSIFRSTCGETLNDIYTNVYAQISWIWFVIEGM